ncbi:outer membrane lipoprotein-sorting protein [uncultured Treponema sp.]|uniref:outer membrane lipoprotein-sorting protein n=1 Tax=uncultured Treponema sp. TaxID=162155 RepID=UPI0025FA8AAB|nr:outer membrane lipoprotein-sorting protein [uncultured Treponema sp.]
MKLLKKFVFASFAFAFGTMAFADDAYDIIKKQSTLDVPDTSQALMQLTNIEKDGSQEPMPMYQYGREVNGLVQTVFDIKGPPKVKDTRVLQMEKNGREDDRWIYQPKLRQVRRIPMGERYKQFVGCEFTYNDMAIRNVDDDKHEMLSENETVTVPSGKTYNCWKIKSTPFKKSEVEYSYRIQYIDKESYLPAKIDYYDKKDHNRIMKVYTTDDWMYLTSKTGKKYAMRMKARVVNNITGRYTTLEVKNPVMDAGISPNYFTQQFLSTGKAK